MFLISREPGEKEEVSDGADEGDPQHKTSMSHTRGALCAHCNANVFATVSSQSSTPYHCNGIKQQTINNVSY